MITDILTYIESFENVRSVCGLNSAELSDAFLGLSLYSVNLSLVLNGTSGVYGTDPAERTLQAIYDSLTNTDEMHNTIQLLSIYTVADQVLQSVGLKAFKTQTDGKASITRFSPESTYMSAIKSVKEVIGLMNNRIDLLLGEEPFEAADLMSTVTPDVDLVLGDE